MNTVNDYPLHAFPTIIQNAILDVYKKTQAPLPLIGSSALGGVSLTCQDAVDVRRMLDLVSPASLFLFTIAQSGERKSTVDKMFLKSIRDFEEYQARLMAPKLDQWRAEKLAWGEEKKGLLLAIRSAAKHGDATDLLTQRLQEIMSRQPIEPQPLKLIINDATPEALVQTLHERWPSAGIMSDEGAIVFDSRAMQRLGLLNSLWAGDEHDVYRATKPTVTLRNARLTFSVMVQPATFQNYLNKKGSLSRDIGFLARCMICAPISTQGTRFINNPDTSMLHLHSFHKRCTEILTRSSDNRKLGSGTRTTLDFTPEAPDCWIKFANWIENSLGPQLHLFDIREYAAKNAENAARMAALFHHFDNQEGSIGIETVSKAIQICQWYMNQFKYLFGNQPQVAPEQVDAWTLESWLHGYFQQNPGIYHIRRNLISQYGPNLLRNRIRRDHALHILSSQGKVIFEKSGKTILIRLAP
jgi:hypothetical protein